MKFALLAAAAAASIIAAPAGAAIYDSGQPTSCCNGPDLSALNFLAGRITFGSTAHVTGIEGYMLTDLNAGSEFTVNVRSNAGDLPDTLLFSEVVVSGAVGDPEWQGATDMDLSLPAGTYWFTFEVPTGSLYDGNFTQDVPNPLQHYAFKSAGSGWQNGGVTPLPMRILGDGGDPVTFDGSSSAPEASTWALMIAGFGMAGATLRRRRAAFA